MSRGLGVWASMAFGGQRSTLLCQKQHMAVSQNKGYGFRDMCLGFRVAQYLFWGVPTNHSIWGSILGSPYLGKLPNSK